jgi:hypothetical protein
MGKDGVDITKSMLLIMQKLLHCAPHHHVFQPRRCPPVRATRGSSPLPIHSSARLKGMDMLRDSRNRNSVQFTRALALCGLPFFLKAFLACGSGVPCTGAPSTPPTDLPVAIPQPCPPRLLPFRSSGSRCRFVVARATLAISCLEIQIKVGCK